MINNDLSLVLWLHEQKISLSHLRFLQEYYQGTQDFLPVRHKIKTELLKYGFIFDDLLTEKGRDLVEQANNWDGIYEPLQKQTKVERTYSEEFLTWWKLFPSNDTFEVDGKSFQGLRNFKTKKDECQTKFDFITKIISPQELIDALRYEIDARVDQSLVRGSNQLSYLQKTHTYLHNKSFEPYLDLAAKGSYKPIRKKEEANNTETVI